MPERIYEEHEKLRGVKERSQAVYDFIEWLADEKGLLLGAYHKHTEDCWGDDDGRRLMCGSVEDELYPTHTSIGKLIAEHFEIDLEKLEDEKRDMLEDLRRVNEELDKRAKEKK